MRRKERQNSGFGFEFDFTHLNSIQLISICIYFLIFVLFYLRMGGEKKRCCCIEIETTMVFGGVGNLESERKDLQATQKRKEKKRIGGEGKGQIPIPIPISNSNFNSRHVVFGHLELTSFPLFFLPLLLLQMYL